MPACGGPVGWCFVGQVAEAPVLGDEPGAWRCPSLFHVVPGYAGDKSLLGRRFGIRRWMGCKIPSIGSDAMPGLHTTRLTLVVPTMVLFPVR